MPTSSFFPIFLPSLIQLHVIGREQPLLPMHVADPPILVGEVNVRNDVALIEGEF